MKILLQDFVPYPESFLWQIHRHYYQHRGSQAWLKHEVPCHITSNHQAAWQHAKILYDILQHLSFDRVATVLEIGAGLGEFAIHFLNSFETLCQTQQTPFSIHYIFADFSHQSLKEATKNPFLKKFQERGQLDFYVLDALSPQTLESLSGSPFRLEESKPLVIIENYLHCTLPLTVVKKKNHQFFEKYVSLTCEQIPQNSSPENLQMELLKNATHSGIFPSLEEGIEYRLLEPAQAIVYQNFRQTLEKVSAFFEEATILFPFASLQHLEKFLPLLHPEGILLISDKGYPDASWMKGEDEIYVKPSIHGNSLAHPVNFPFLETFAQEKGYRTCRTTQRKYYLQSLAIVPSTASSQGEESFKHQFVLQNLNQEAEVLWLQAFEEKQKKNWRSAKNFLLECLRYRTQDCCLFYELGQICLGLEEYTEALQYFQQGIHFNYFQEHDFFFNQGKAYLGMHDFLNALKAFETSMRYFPSYPWASYNIGLVYEGLKNYWQALRYYRQALKPNPQDPQQTSPDHIRMLVKRKYLFFLILSLLCFSFFLFVLFLSYWFLFLRT